MATLLPKKSSQGPLATDDDHQAAMTADPTIPQFPQGDTNNATTNTISSGSTAFGIPQTNGFISPANFGSSTTVMSNNAGTAGQYQPPILTAAGSNAAQDAEVLVANDNTDWINKKWRPAMGWMYMTVCIFDFILFPVLWAVVQFWETQAANDAFRQWQPMTLQGAGLFHIAMGAVLGITAYGRTKEKVEGKA